MKREAVLWLHIITDPYVWNDKEPRYTLYKTGGKRAMRRGVPLKGLLAYALPFAARHQMNVVLHNRDGTIRKIYYQTQNNSTVPMLPSIRRYWRGGKWD